MNRTKDYRRAQEKKEKEHAKHIVKDVWHEEELANNPTFIGKMAHSPQLCSCDMCGNPRHAPYGSDEDKLTLQERKSNEDLKEMINENEETN